MKAEGLVHFTTRVMPVLTYISGSRPRQVGRREGEKGGEEGQKSGNHRRFQTRASPGIAQVKFWPIVLITYHYIVLWDDEPIRLDK